MKGIVLWETLSFYMLLAFFLPGTLTQVIVTTPEPITITLNVCMPSGGQTLYKKAFKTWQITTQWTLLEPARNRSSSKHKHVNVLCGPRRGLYSSPLAISPTLNIKMLICWVVPDVDFTRYTICPSDISHMPHMHPCTSDIPAHRSRSLQKYWSGYRFGIVGVSFWNPD